MKFRVYGVELDAKDYFPQALPRKIRENMDILEKREALEVEFKIVCDSIFSIKKLFPNFLIYADMVHRCIRYELKIDKNLTAVDWNEFNKSAGAALKLLHAALKNGDSKTAIEGKIIFEIFRC